jgi:hypothetical protein
MNIALLGNCQLQQIGWLLKAFFALHKLPIQVVWHDPVYALGDLKAPIVPLFAALETADVIYGQFHDRQWNALSTESLQKYFDIRLVPTLDSPASFPQMNYFIQPSTLNFGLYSVDFRMLDLYLEGCPVSDVPRHYGAIAPNAGAVHDQVLRTTARYRRMFEAGQLRFDYADKYATTIREQGLGAFFVHNHPNNSQLQWLANEILKDIGAPQQVSLQDLPEILVDTQVPALGEPDQQHYRLRATEVGLPAASKINYVFFSSYDRGFLREELAESIYLRLTRSGPVPTSTPGLLTAMAPV